MEESHRVGSGARIGPDYGADSRNGDLREFFAVSALRRFNKAFQALRIDAGVGEADRARPVDPAELVDGLQEGRASAFDAADFPHDLDDAFLNGDHGLDGQDPAHPCRGGRKASSELQVFQSVKDGQDVDPVLQPLQFRSDLFRALSLISQAGGFLCVQN